MPVTVTSEATVPAEAELVGVPVASGAKGPVLLGERNGAVIPPGFEGKLGETATVEDTIFVGVGAARDVTPDVVRRASAALVKEASKRPSVVNALLEALPEGGDRVAAAQAAAEGTLLASYRFSRYKKDPSEPKSNPVVPSSPFRV